LSNVEIDSCNIECWMEPCFIQIIMKGGGMMSLTFYSYPKCGTCRKAKKWLEDQGIAMNEIHIVENPPSKDELKSLYEKSNLSLKKFFNTSGKKYRELGLKDKVNSASDEELLEILSTDGMLIKRPITTDGNKVTVGFKEETFEETWK
jgi:arsenate reductase (glutaredoxin)